MVNGGGWSPAKGGRRGKNYQNSNRIEGDRRGAVQRRVWDELGRNRRKGFVNEIRDSSISFFFTNFPDDASNSELWKVFSGVGDVVDVFIPSKVDKLGRRFGFVRFIDERDVPRLERRLKQVWLGTFKLQVNKSHAPVSDAKGKAKVVDVAGAGGGVQRPETGSNKQVQNKNEGSIFKWGAVQNNDGWKKNQGGRKNITFNIEYAADEDRVKMLNSCYVGILAESRSATALEFQHSLIMEGYHAIKATPMGGDSILLSSSVEGAITDAISSNRGWWSSWLRGFSVWDPNLISSRRRVWLRCVGVPLHVWEERFFTSLALRFGKCEEVEEATKQGIRFDVGRVRVLTAYPEPIDQSINLYVGGELFPVTVVEERFGNIDGGMELPPQLSAPQSSSGSDNSCSGDGGVCGGGGYETYFGLDIADEGWDESDARFRTVSPAAGEEICSFGSLLRSDECVQRKDKLCENLGCSVRENSLCSEVGVACTDSTSRVVETAMGTVEKGGTVDYEHNHVSATFEEKSGWSLENNGMTARCVGEGTPKVKDAFIGDMVDSTFGSGLPLLFDQHKQFNVDSTLCGLENNNLANCGHHVGLHNSPTIAQIGLINSPPPVVEFNMANLVVPDSISQRDKVGPPSINEARSLAPPPPAGGIGGRRGGRRGRTLRGGRSGYGRGASLTGTFSTSHRFLHFARGNGRRARAGPSNTAPSSISEGIQLHFDLPNLNDLPACAMGDADASCVEEVIGGVGVASFATSGAGASQSGNLAAERMLEIGRKIGVTFRSGDDTMIEKFAQLEDRDKREKEERVLRNNGHQ